MKPSKTSDLFSSKRMLIDKANATMVLSLAISSFIFVFSIVAVKALWSQRGYQQRVISKKEEARNQLKKNVDASKELAIRYQSFISESQNAIGGDPNGSGPKDGDNAKIILDALPSKYDFPAMATSMKSLFTSSGIAVTSLSGTDQEATQSKNSSAVVPAPVEMPFTVTVEGKYDAIKGMIKNIEHSIRPVFIDSIVYSGSDKKLTVTIAAKTYFQPEKSLKINTELVK